MFHALERIFGEPKPSFSQLVHNRMVVAFKRVRALLSNHKKPQSGKGCICKPFVNKPRESSMSLQKEDQLLEIASDSCLKTKFETTTLPVFWIKVMAEYPEIATTSLKTTLLAFPTS